MNAAEVTAAKAQIASANANAPQTVNLPDTPGAAPAPTAPATPAPPAAPATPAAPAAPPAPTTAAPGSVQPPTTPASPTDPAATPTPTAPASDIMLDGVPLNLDQLRQMRDANAAIEAKEADLARREIVQRETGRQLGLAVDELLQRDPNAAPATPAPGDPNAQPATTIEPPAPSQAATEIVAALTPLTASVAALERSTAIQALRTQHGDINEQAVLQAMDAHGVDAPTAHALVVGAQTLLNQQAQPGADAARRAGEAARTETGSAAGVVPTTQPKTSTLPWGGALDQEIVRANIEAGTPLLSR